MVLLAFGVLHNGIAFSQCGGYFILVSDNYNGTKTRAFSVDLSTGGLTAISDEFTGYLTALAVNPTSTNLFLADPPDQPGLVAPIYLGTPYITSLTNTNVNLGGPRLCGDQNGTYLYSVTSAVPFNNNTQFSIRRSNLNTFVEEEALVTDFNGVPIYNNSDGDLQMTSEGYLFVLDGNGKLVRVDLTTWDSNNNTVKATNLGNFKPALFDQYFAIAQDTKGNFIATGSNKRIYRFDLATKKANIIAELNYDGTGFPPLSSIATDAASCIYPVYHSVSGYVFIDWNQNGVKNTGENGTGVTPFYAKIIAGTGAAARVVAVATIDPTTGYYKFDTSIPNSSYRVKYSTNSDLTDTTYIIPSGFSNTSPEVNNITMDNADIVNVNFGLYNAALAVDALSLEAIVKNNQVQLQWISKNETNNSHYIIERSRDGATFEALGVVKALGNTVGLSNYGFTDSNPILGHNYYRLQAIDNNLETKYSEVVTVFYNPANGIISIAPNPASEEIRIGIEGVKSGTFKASIYTFNGQLQYESNPFLVLNDLTWKLDISTLQNGWYFVKIVNEEENIQMVQKLSVCKK